MAVCINCGHELNDGARFCELCGTAVNSGSEQARKQVFEGNIHKCPNCGEVLNSFSSFCPSCGYEIRNVKAAESIRDLSYRIENAGSIDEKASIIRHFPIPNTYEDIVEFLIIASSNIDDKNEEALSAAWETKLDQVIQKARILFRNKSELVYIETQYDQIIKESQKSSKRKSRSAAASEITQALPQTIIIFGWLLSIFVLLPLCRTNLDVVGTNASQMLLILDFIAGAVFVPYVLRNESIFPKLLVSAGIILSIVFIVPLCRDIWSIADATAFQTILIIEVVCCIIILIRTIRYDKKNHIKANTPNRFTFLTLLVCLAILAGVYGIVTLCLPKSSIWGDDPSFLWPSSILASQLPEPVSKECKVISNSNKRLYVDLYNASEEMFLSYVEACREKGFVIDEVIDGNSLGDSFDAYNAEGYRLSLDYYSYSHEISVSLDAAIQMGDINWPNSNLANRVPLPASDYGKIESDSSNMFAVYIGNTAAQDYNDYVDICFDSGFNVDHYRDEKCFRAYDRDGYKINVSYEGFNTIEIIIHAPEQS